LTETTTVEKLHEAQGFMLIGKRIQRLDAVEKVLGLPLYTSDIVPKDALRVKVVRSTVPHALIKRIDTQPARQVPGVIAVLTAEDIPGINEAYALLPDRPLLANKKVRCHGEAMAVVAAGNLETTEEAADRVSVEYERLPAVTSPVEAMKQDCVLVHDNGNVAKYLKVRKGDVKEGFRQADVIIENTYKTQFQDPTPLEPEVGMAWVEKDGSITCVGSMQTPYYVQTGVAKVLGLSPDKVRVIQATTGGAFGPKSDEMPVDTCAISALVAQKTGKPAILAYSREESMIAHTKRHPFVITLKTGAKSDGRLTASEALLVSDTGAYASLGPLVIIRACFHATGPYVIPNVKTDAYCMYTNNTMAGSFRGFGSPQVHFAAESQMDELARKLDMDPLDLRLKNILRPGTLTATSQPVDEACGLEECAKRATEASCWHAKRLEFGRDRSPFRPGIGLALMYHGNSLGPEGNDYAYVHMLIKPDARIVVRTALTEYGTGAISGLAQVAAETLGVPIHLFELGGADTASCSETGPTVASRVIVIGGRATQIAAQKLKEKLLSVASPFLQCEPSKLTIRGELVSHLDDPKRAIPFRKVVEECYKRHISLTETGYYIAPKCEFESENSQGTTYLQYTYGAVVAEVQVDTELGVVKPLKITAAYDVGRAINPLSVEGQIEGGTIQGLGYGLMEQLVHSHGMVANPTLGDYYIPTSLDIPELQTIIVEYPGAVGPYGAKAMGEPPVDLPAAALANAVAHATGSRVFELPLTAEKVLFATRSPH
jgi:CO/xanthine dehydrogenase Mo-binding subunit